MKYTFSIPSEHQRFVKVDIELNGPFNGDKMELHLPSWRPGRYELGNFAKNLKGFEVTDENGKPLAFHKSDKDTWVIDAKCKMIKASYLYYAAQPDAGACYLDHDQLYINPVHCCMYCDDRMDERCEIILDVPSDWQVATGMKAAGNFVFECENFDRLADSPFIASPSLQHKSYEVNGVEFHIWLQGNCNPGWDQIISDFRKFTEVQLKMMGSFPANDFHFLVQLLPTPFYHGVEHLNSTVLALGPGHNLMKPALYSDFLGVASHELFHCWNVKTIRPVEMLPYNFKKENYSSSGYVYEGVTTYYGDLFLGRSGFFSFDDLMSEYSVRVQKHMDNSGRFNYAVAESSFDTWLDGYVPGVPGRKTSIYDEGCLLAWMLDFMIRNATNSEKSLDDVMRILYQEYALKNKGYSGDDFQKIAEQVAGTGFDDFFRNRVFKASSLDSLLNEIVALAGIQLIEIAAGLMHERKLGMKLETRGGGVYITTIAPGSPAAKAGLLKDDEIIGVNGIRTDGSVGDLFDSFEGAELKLLIASSRKIREQVVIKDSKNYWSKFVLKSIDKPSDTQLKFRNNWLQK